MEIRSDVALDCRTTMGVGGAATHFVEAADEATLIEALGWADRHGVAARILGGGSNVVVADGGFDGLVIQIALRGVDWNERGDEVEVRAAAGEPWDELVAAAVGRGAAGLECLSGIPGQVGATPIQNVGAYGQEVGTRIRTVRTYDRQRREVVDLSADDCRFAYRDSRFKSDDPNRFVVVEVTFQLDAGGTPEIRYAGLSEHLRERGVATPSLNDVRESVLAIRRDKSMLSDPEDPNGRSCGSFFVNPIVDPKVCSRLLAEHAELPHWPGPDGREKLAAAWLIEHTGFTRGHERGPVGLSTAHALCLVSHDGARADDVVSLARTIRAGVEQRFGVRLTPEPSFWGFASLDDGLPDDRLA